MPSFPKVTAVWMSKDPSDLDNAINMLSALSFTSLSPERSTTWAEKFKTLKRVLGGLWSEDTAFMAPGGNCPSGVLGQISAMLEFVEQARDAGYDRITRLYLPVGSSCTISGLVLGVVLARRVFDASTYDGVFASTFEIVGTPIHHAAAFAQRNVNFLRSDIFSFCPLTITHTVRSTVDLLARLLGSEHRIVRNLEADALAFVRTRVRLDASKDVVGTYGGHSKLSRVYADAYDRTGAVFASSSPKSLRAPDLWLCGHFAAKAFATMIADLDHMHSNHNDAVESSRVESVVFWQTKSRVQSAGSCDEFARARAFFLALFATGCVDQSPRPRSDREVSTSIMVIRMGTPGF